MSRNNYINCAGCGDFIGPHSPAIELNYGFLEEESMYVEQKCVYHKDCIHSHSIGELLEKVEHV